MCLFPRFYAVSKGGAADMKSRNECQERERILVSTDMNFELERTSIGIRSGFMEL